ncbi:MAG: quinone oxidoreductase [Rhodospirillaceae bacterium]|nr:quinone oxidoreductase [Rhodospirillaceae bacterium]MBT5523370.1 quinone oxidoreductase [Rhodospirillaceae bacterium]MBT5877555.1 quinone oxidoreductase [Rhodospirillaceae bacterium]MBT6909583.1 quinone oxidoreductase [Rhodospirillaceae bacterium]MBT6986385.1 quinone oxidoreductase [Rhodospirillaceae bacterium]
MVKAIQFHKAGRPSVIKWEDVKLGKPKKGQAQVRHTAIGLNYIDTYHRGGLYPLPMPSGLGTEGAGVVEAVGPGVKHVKAGDRVAYAGGTPGAYSEARNMDAGILVKIPRGISDEAAAAMMLKGMTVEYLVRRTYPVKKGQTVLFHAAAGGVGLIAGQWLNALGVRAIGTAGSPAKVKLAKAHGYAEVIDYNKKDFVKEVARLTNKEGVPVVYDSIGKSTWDGSLDCLQPRGYMVSFGNASGAVDSFAPGILAAKGSLFLTRPSLLAYNSTRKELEASSKALFAMVKSGKIKIEINQTYALKDAKQAHIDLEARKTTGSTILIP